MTAFKPFPSRATYESSLQTASDDQINDICYICQSPQKSTTPQEDRCIGPPILMTCCAVNRVVGKACLQGWLNSPASDVNKCIACHKLLYHKCFYRRVEIFLNERDPLDKNAQATFGVGVLACVASLVVAWINWCVHWRWLRLHPLLSIFVYLWCVCRPIFTTFLGLYLQIPRQSRRIKDLDPNDVVVGVFFPLQAFERQVRWGIQIPVYPSGRDCGIFYRLMMWLRGVSKRWLWRKHWSDAILILQLIDLGLWTVFALFGLLMNVIWIISMVTGIEV